MSGKERKNTPQQERAITTRGVSVVLASGAGCGKTSVLTARYLSHLERGEADPSRLVAITFTEKAAREMRGRIRKAVSARLAAAADESDRDRWQNYLRGLETASVSTIHSFCTSLLRQHALAAGLDPQFGVAEPPVAGVMRATAVRETLINLLTKAGADGEALRELVKIFGWYNTRDTVEEMLKSPDAEWSRWLDKSAAEVARMWQDRSKAELLPAYVNHLCRSGGAITETMRLLASVNCPMPKMAARIQRVLELIPSLAKAPDLAAALEEVNNCAKVQGAEPAKQWPDAAMYEAIQESLKKFREAIKGKFDAFLESTDSLAPAAQIARAFIRVALACEERYTHEKARAACLDFQDQLVAARDLLRDHADVRAALRRRIEFLLVDELQDTDAVQMEIVKSLCGSELTSGKLFAVGDAKQSIYRFRGAIVELFEELQTEVPESGRQSLTDNFRSQREILRFTNALLMRHMAPFEPLVNGLEPVGDHACVEFLWSPRIKGENVDAARRFEAGVIARRIQQMIGREKLIAEREEKLSLRPVRAGDVVLLFRAMTNVDIYETALREHGLDYYLVGGKAFFAQQEVYDLYHLLRALENPHDGLSLAAALRSPFGCVSDELLYLLATHPRGIWTALHDDAACGRLPESDRPTIERVRQWLARWRLLKDRVRLPDLISRILADCGYDAALQFEHLGDRKLANLWKLVELARTFDSTGRLGLDHFVHQLGELMSAQQLEEQAATQPEESDAVRLMSIHQAKGLEFPVVFIPDFAAEHRGPTAKAAVWDTRLGCVPRPPKEDDPPLFSSLPRKLWEIQEKIDGWNDDLRTLYVACTRAQDYLIFSGSLPENDSAKNTAMTVLTSRFDLHNGHCLDDSIPEAERPKVIVAELGDESAMQTARKREQAITPLTSADVKGILPISASVSTGIAWIEERDFTAPGVQRDLIRRVLADWNLSDPQGWRSLLAALEDVPAARLGGTVAKGFGLFAKSSLFQELVAAEECHCAVEFAVTPESGPVMCGVIDFVWRDVKGWHVAAIALPDKEDHALAIAAAAVNRQCGTAPISSRIYDWATGKTR